MRSRSPRRCATKASSDRRAAPARTQRGVAAVELALVLPVLLLMVLSIFDLARTIQANMILVATSREGASLASRSSGYSQPQIMDALAETTPPLNMAANGMIYITRVMGVTESTGAVSNKVIEQYRWQAGFAVSGYAPKSAFWTCGDSGSTTWDGTGKCAGLPSPSATSPTTTLMAGKLASGEAIYAVEVFYRYTPLVGVITLAPGVSTPGTDPNLYALTVF